LKNLPSISLQTSVSFLPAKRSQGLTSAELQEQKRLNRKQRRLQAGKRNKNKASKVQGGAAGTSPDKDATPIVKTPTKPIKSKDGSLVFSKFDFTNSGGSSSSSSSSSAFHTPLCGGV
jgi:hypothetical protein